MSLMILTAHVGTNADLIPHIFSLYVPRGSTVADVTYGRGVFWSKIDKEEYKVLESDLLTGVDFRSLPYESSSVDCVILDPPYMHGGSTIKESLNKCYRNDNTSHASVIRLYARGVLEACRVLRKNGIIILKSQDEIESGKQRFSHIELITLLRDFGYEILDLFCLVQNHAPLLREKVQKHARKNHSYAIVGRFKA